MMKRFPAIACLFLALLPLGCQSASKPLRPAAATQPATPATATIRYLRQPHYDRLWQASLALVHDLGYRTDRLDYRHGILTTKPRGSADLVELWRPDRTTALSSAENTVNNQRRTLRLTFTPVAQHPDYYEVIAQVLVERETNPTGTLAGPVFAEGSSFGRNPLSLRSDTADEKAAPEWIIVGHDADLEAKILDRLLSTR